MSWELVTEPKVIQSVGLVLDIAGILILFKYQIDFNRDVGTGPKSYGLLVATEERDPAEEERFRKYVRRTYVGMSLIAMGFLVQAVALWM